jgi:thioesterase domain-containing protein
LLLAAIDGDGTADPARGTAGRSLFARISGNAKVLVPLNASASDPKATGTSLYCVHSITGAGGTDFLALARHLDGAVRMFGVQAPPKLMADPQFGARVPELAEIYADAIMEGQPSGPIILAGWCAGAVVALELGRHLRARGREVALVVAIDGSPEIAGGAPLWHPRYWLKVVRNLPAWFVDCRAADKGFPFSNLRLRASECIRWARRLAARQQPEFPPALGRLVSGFDRFPAAQRQFMARLYFALRAHRPQSWDGPVLVYEAKVSPVLVPAQHLERWLQVAPRAELTLLKGTHATIMCEPRVADLARHLEQCIDGAVANLGAGQRGRA